MATWQVDDHQAAPKDGNVTHITEANPMSGGAAIRKALHLYVSRGMVRWWHHVALRLHSP